VTYVLTKDVGALCTHGGTAQGTAPSPRVKIAGSPVLVVTSQFTISGCSNNVSGAPMPCVSSTVAVGASRVKSNGMPVLLQSGTAVNLPTGASLTFVPAQTRVKGQ
jgi:hypothetical protein